MLTCIACSKQQLHDAGDDTPRGTPSTKPAAKSLTSQIKDVVLKLSGAYRQSKAGGPSTPAPYRRNAHLYRTYYDDILEVEGGLINGGNGKKTGEDARWESHPNSTGASKGGSSSSSSTPAAARRFLRPNETWVPAGGNHDGDSCCEQPVMLEEDNEPKEWVAQVEPGVHITFLALPQGGNDLKRIRFSREIFNKLQAQRWWGENYDRIMELYNVQRFNRQALPTPPRSEDERDTSSYSRMGSRRESPAAPGATIASSNYQNAKVPAPTGCSNGLVATGGYYPTPDPTEHFFPRYHLQTAGTAVGFVAGGPVLPVRGEGSSLDASRTTTSSRDEASASNASDMFEMTEWVEEDQPGVYITIRQMADGTRDLRRVRFSRERFGEVNAKLWWEENRDRIHEQYLGEERRIG